MPRPAASDGLPSGPRSFATTHWSLVQQAGAGSAPASRQALATLCEAYWYPLYAYVRRRGVRADEAADLTQAFFARLLEKRDLKMADPQRGRFRSFLLAAMNHFLANHWRAMRAQKRGGGKAPIPLDAREGEDRYRLEPAHDLTAERIFQRRWALTLIEQALDDLRDRFAADGKARQFEALKPCLTGDGGESYGAIGQSLGMNEGAVRVAVYRLRKRYRDALRDRIAQTVADPADVDQEMRELLASLAV
jgi:RNA polymerase sigma-70 factor (ECF subfamily)